MKLLLNEELVQHDTTLLQQASCITCNQFLHQLLVRMQEMSNVLPEIFDRWYSAGFKF